MMRQSACPVADGPNVREVGLLGLAQIRHQSTGGLNRRCPAIEPEAFEAVGLQLIEERPSGGLQIECPAIGVGQRNLQPRQAWKSVDHSGL